MNDSGDDITTLLVALGDGRDPDVWARLYPLVFGELRRIAARRLRQERLGHTLQPTAIVNDAFVSLVDQSRITYRNRSHFYALAARAVRQILVQSARRRSSLKRGGPAAQRESADMMEPRREAMHPLDLLAINESLEELMRHEERAGRVVELRIFGGLTIEETAAALDVSQTTVERDWNFARSWLFARLTDHAPGGAAVRPGARAAGDSATAPVEGRGA